MKKFFLAFLLFGLFGISAAAISDTTHHPLPFKSTTRNRLINEKAFEDVEGLNDTVRLQNMTVLEFKELLGKHESGNNYQLITEFGFKGKYSLSDYLIGKLTELTPTQFLTNPNEQEIVMNKVIYLYLQFLKEEKLLKYVNQKIGGVFITLEKLLAGCHFSPKNLRLFLLSNGLTDFNDGSVSIGGYIASF